MKFRNLPRLATTFYLLLLYFFQLVPVALAQSGTLTSLLDQVNTKEYYESASHTVSFSLPWNSLPIRTTDWILIHMTNFGNITLPTSISGMATGTPQFSLDGKVIKITGVALSPGNMINISGITATNPAVDSAFQIGVMIAEDEAGTLIKNLGTAYSTTNQGNVAVTASIDTPQSRLIISGYGSPQAFVTYTEDGAVTGTEVSATSGYFSHIFSGIQPGDHQITFYAVDHYNLATSPVTISVYTPTYQETSVTNQILSPTVSIDKSRYSLGDPINASGTAAPNSSITLFTESPLRAYTTTTNSAGDWAYTITNTNQYMLGDYHIHAIVQTGSGLTSLNSPSIGFSIVSTTSSTGSACGNISRGDLNCDSAINLTDFSILMYYWGTNNATADMNRDLIVDLTDFSVMMYYWGT